MPNTDPTAADFVLPDIVEANKGKRIFGLFTMGEGHKKAPMVMANGRHQSASPDKAELWSWNGMAEYAKEHPNSLPSLSVPAFEQATGLTLLLDDLDEYKLDYSAERGKAMLDAALGTDPTFVGLSASGKGKHIWRYTREPLLAGGALARYRGKSKGIDHLRTFVVLSGKCIQDVPVDEFKLTEKNRQFLAENVKADNPMGIQKPLLHQDGTMSPIVAANMQLDLEREALALGFTSDEGRRWMSPNGQTSAGGLVLPSRSGPWDILVTYNETGLEWIPQAKSGRVADAAHMWMHRAVSEGRAKSPKHALKLLADGVEAITADGELLGKTVHEFNQDIEMNHPPAAAPDAGPKVAADGTPYCNLPMPESPFLREVINWLMQSCMVHRQRDIAIASAWAMVAAFSGRKDSFNGNPPTFDGILIAATTSGKDTASKAMNLLVPAMAEHGFMFAEAFTPMNQAMGPFKMILAGLKRVSGLRIHSEAGVQGDSLSGDQASVRAMLLQNVAQNAYSRWTAPDLRDVEQLPIGVNISSFMESTLVAMKKHIRGTGAKGDAGRRLLFNVNASKLEWFEEEPDWAVPDNIVNGFVALAEEAMRNETTGDASIMGGHPIKERRQFRGSPEVEEFFHRLRVQEFEYRTHSDQQSLEFQLAGRYRQLLMRLSLIAARTRHITMGRDDLTVIEMQDVEDAKALLDECRKTEMRNAGLHDGPEHQLASEIRKWAFREFDEGNEPSASYARVHLGPRVKREEYFEKFGNKHIKQAFFSGSCEATKVLAKELAQEHHKRTTEMFRDAVAQGEAEGFWDVMVDGRTTWLQLRT